jgi:hypothetical protein
MAKTLAFMFFAKNKNKFKVRNWYILQTNE